MAAVGVRGDPLLNHNFVISLVDSSSTLALLGAAALSAIADVALGGFNECSGLEMSLQVEEYKEGGRNGTVLKFPTRVTWSNITLKTGIGAGTALWDWHYGFVEGRGHRRDGLIVLLDELRVPNHIWYFRRGLPVKYTGPPLNATQNNVAIESIEIAHEGIYQLPSSTVAAGFGGKVMEVQIGDVTSTVRAVDSDSLLAPQTMEKIVRIVLQAVRDQEEHGKRVRAEQRVTGGVRQELEEEK